MMRYRREPVRRSQGIYEARRKPTQAHIWIKNNIGEKSQKDEFDEDQIELITDELFGGRLDRGFNRHDFSDGSGIVINTITKSWWQGIHTTWAWDFEEYPPFPPGKFRVKAEGEYTELPDEFYFPEIARYFYPKPKPRNPRR